MHGTFSLGTRSNALQNFFKQVGRHPTFLKVSSVVSRWRMRTFCTSCAFVRLLLPAIDAPRRLLHIFSYVLDLYLENNSQLQRVHPGGPHTVEAGVQLITRDHMGPFVYSQGCKRLWTRQHLYLTRNSHLSHSDSLGSHLNNTYLTRCHSG